MHDNQAESDGRSLASTRSVEIVVALVLLTGSIVFIYDSVRTGFGWREDGPAPGFFPFWIAVLLAGSSVMNLIRALSDKAAADDSFVSGAALGRVLAVLVPTTLFVGAIGGVEAGPLQVPGLGIYVASALFIAGFMWMLSEAAPAGTVLRMVSGLVVLAATAGLTAALLWLLSKGNLPLSSVDIPYALPVALVLVMLPLGMVGKVVTLGPAVAVVLYAMFEVWFKVPLVKGPVEVLLGIG